MKNKGFTLVELLAVIVILAVIALIAVPIVLGIINDSRDESNKISIEMYAKAVKNALLLHEMNGVGDASGKFTAVDAYTIKNEAGVTLKLEYGGNEVICDNIQISSTAQIYLSGCKVDGELVDYSYGKITTLKDVILSNYGGESSITELTSIEFSKTSDIMTGLYKTTDDYGDSYYFRGNVENNYLVFGKWPENVNVYMADGPTPEYYFTLEECLSGGNHNEYGTDCNKLVDASGKQMYWRIVRVNGDGSIRLIYDGVDIFENGVYHNAVIHPIHYFDYIDKIYTSGSTAENQQDSDIKIALDKWYNLTLKSQYQKYISDSIFCSQTSSELASYKPTLQCLNISDKYTVSDTSNGNGYLDNPVGLLTADEAVFAGEPPLIAIDHEGVQKTAMNYLNFTEVFTTATPYWSCNYDNKLYKNLSGINNSINPEIRPVINLKADVGFTGTGTITDPYVIVTE